MLQKTKVFIAAVAIIFAAPTQADWLNSLKKEAERAKEKAAGVLGTVRDVKETVTITKEVIKEGGDVADSVRYQDPYSPSHQEVRLLQSKLNAQGYDAGRPDGQLGERTRRALRHYQSNIGLPVNGLIDYSLYQRLVSAAPQSQVQIHDTRRERLSNNEWKQYQRLLNELGYNAGPADGLPGRRTKTAVEQFLRDYNLSAYSTGDREGFSVIKQVVYGVAPTENAVASDNSISTINSEQTLHDAVSREALLTSETLLIGGDPEEQRSAVDALALALVAANPDLLDGRGVLESWFEYEGRSVESSYLLPDALRQLKEEILQRPVPVIKNILLHRTANLTKGQYNLETGIFPVAVQDLNRSIVIPQLSDLRLSLPVSEQFPLLQEKHARRNMSFLGVAMTREQAISLERQRMSDRRKRQTSLKLVTAVAPSKYTFPNLSEMQYALEARMDVTVNTIDAYFVDGTNRAAGELFYQWAPLPLNNNDSPRVATGVDEIARRFGMTVIDGHINPAKGDSTGLIAAMVLSKQPELLDVFPQSLILARALLTRKEQTKIFGQHGRRLEALDSVAQARIMESISGEYRSLLLSRAVPVNIPLLTANQMVVKSYDRNQGLFPLEMRSEFYSRFQKIPSTGGISAIADVGDRWVPTSIPVVGDDAMRLRDRLFDRHSGLSANAHLVRFGTTKDLSVEFLRGNQYALGSVSVSIRLEYDRERLYDKNLEEPVHEFPRVHPEQKRFSDVMAAIDVPLADRYRIMGSVMHIGETPEFKNQFVQSSRLVKNANEFDRDEAANKATQYVENKMNGSNEPLWLAGQIRVGEYDFAAGEFSVVGITFTNTDRTEPAGGHYFAGKIHNKSLGAIPALAMTKEQAEKVVRAFPKGQPRLLQMRARVVPLGAVTELSERSRYSTLTVTHRIEEVYVLNKPERSHRQNWEILGHIVSATENTLETETEENKTITFDSDRPLLDQDMLLLHAAQSQEVLSNEAWDWLMRNRWAYDNGVKSTVTTRFFEPGALFPDKSSAQILRPKFIAWVQGLNLPTYENVVVQLNFGASSASNRSRHNSKSDPVPLAQVCGVVVGELSTAFAPRVATFDTKYSASERHSRTMGAYGQEFIVEHDANAGFSMLSAVQCHQQAKQSGQRQRQPSSASRLTLTFDTLPYIADRSAELGLVNADVEKITFSENNDGLPDITVKLKFDRLEIRDSFDPTSGSVLKTLSASDIAPKEPEGKDMRIEQSDIVAIKLGLNLADASKLVESHFGESSRYKVRRGFTTNPQPFENADIWVNKDGNEYIALFFEGDRALAKVLGVTRGMRLAGVEFNRETALQMLRLKYGAEEIVKADRNLNLVWGKYVSSWPEQVGKSKGYRSVGQEGACKLNWNTGKMPSKAEDADGKTVHLRSVLPQGSGIYFKWPSIRNQRQAPEECDFYLEAFHDDRSDPEVFVGMFDINAYQMAFAQSSSMSATVERTAPTPDANQGSAVKF